MFMPDVVAALSEMRAGGRAAGPRRGAGLERALSGRPGSARSPTRSPGTPGPDAAELVGTYFRLGDTGGLAASCARAGLRVLEIRPLPITVHAPSVDDYVTAEVESTPLVARLDAGTVPQDPRGRARRAGPVLRRDRRAGMPFEVCLVSARRSVG